MKPRITLLTLAVDDLDRAVAFYRDGMGFGTPGIIGTEFEHGAVAFFELQAGLKLALYPRALLAKETGLPLTPPSALELSIGQNVGNRDEVDTVMAQAVRSGARVVKAAQDMFWGGYAGYFQDPEAHLWEIAWNPQMMPPD